MNKKRIICLVLALVMALSVLASCGSALSSASSASSGSSDSSADSAVTSDFDYSAGLTEAGMFDGLKASDYVTLPDYKSINIPAEHSVANEEDVQAQMDSILSNYTTTNQIKDRAVTDSDTVNIDYVGKVDGKEFEGGSATGSTVTIGVTNFIDGFLDQLVGHTPGETFDIQVTFPEDYGKEDLNGKDAIFTITLNYIEEKVVPQMSDDFVKENLSESYGYNTVDELKASIQKSLIQNQEYSYVWQAMLDDASFTEVPAAVTEFERGQMLQYYTNSAKQYGMELATLLSYYGYDDADAFLDANGEQIENDCKTLLCVQAIAEAEGMTATDEEIASALGAEDIAEYVTFYGHGYLSQYVLQNKVTQLLLDNAARA